MVTATTGSYTYGHTLSLHDALPIRAGEGGTPARRPSAILRVELRGGELQKLDRFRVAHRAAHPLAGIEVDERLVRERVAQDLRFRPLGDQIALPEIAEGDGEAVRRDIGHVLRLHHRIAQQRRRLARRKARLPDERSEEHQPELP